MNTKNSYMVSTILAFSAVIATAICNPEVFAGDSGALIATSFGAFAGIVAVIAAVVVGLDKRS